MGKTVAKKTARAKAAVRGSSPRAGEISRAVTICAELLQEAVEDQRLQDATLMVDRLEAQLAGFRVLLGAPVDARTERDRIYRELVWARSLLDESEASAEGMASIAVFGVTSARGTTGAPIPACSPENLRKLFTYAIARLGKRGQPPPGVLSTRAALEEIFRLLRISTSGATIEAELKEYRRRMVANGENDSQ